MDSTIGKPIKLNSADYYHLSFTHTKKDLDIFMLYLYKSFIVRFYTYTILQVQFICYKSIFCEFIFKT